MRLRLSRSEIDLDELLRMMIDLYEPSMSERGLQIRLRSAGPVTIDADAALIHRMIANLFDNEMKHLPAPMHGDGAAGAGRRSRHCFRWRTMGQGLRPRSAAICLSDG